MELLARAERAAEQNVQYYLKANDEPIVSLHHALEDYRQACQASIFADFEKNAAGKERALWHAHTEGKKYFHRALSGLRKQPSGQEVAIRQLIKFYLQFIKDSQRFYRDYIYRLSTTFGGIPELQAVAHQVKNTASGENSQAAVTATATTTTTPALRDKVLESCHQTLIYLGDLSRYRASEKLDKTPDFGPAIGYYSLACTLLPTSGMGHHQLAVIALEQRQHLRAIHQLYRAMVVAGDPHPNAAHNLKLEFDKTNAAWDRGELIQKGEPNDPEASKRMLAGWFVRLHSMCFRGEPFRGFEELEREVLGQLAKEIKVRALDGTLMRMIGVNLAAQFFAGESFQENPIPQNQHAFIHFFRINIKTFTTLLHVFYEDLKTVDLSAHENDEEADIELATRLTDITRRTLPALRLYSSWLLSMINLLTGLSGEEFLTEPINQFWRVYARSVDLIAAVFPIWDLEDLPEINYMLEEDTDTIGFKPLVHERTSKIWRDKQTGVFKPRFSDLGVLRASPDEEMLARVREFLVDGLFLANDDDDAPIKLRGTRILHRDAEDVEPLPIPVQTLNTTKAVFTSTAKVTPKPPTYAAAAAANGPSQPPPPPSQPVKPNGVPPPPPSKPSGMSRHAQLSRMVDDLVDDDGDNTNVPITPPQQHSSYPAVVTKGDVSYPSIIPIPAGSSAQDLAPHYSSYYYQQQQKLAPIGTPSAAAAAAAVGGGGGGGETATSPTHRYSSSPKIAVTGTPIDRLQTLSSLWNDAPPPPVSSFPTGLPTGTGTLSSPAQLHSRGHSRVNSASSIRSRTSLNMGMNTSMGIADSWSSIEGPVPGSRATLPVAAAVAGPPAPLTTAFGNGLEQSSLASPLLFGAGGGVWSTSTSTGASARPVSRGGRNVITPPSGQGGG